MRKRHWKLVASAPIQPVTGQVDSRGRLIAADAPLLRLQQEAGAGLNQPLAVPQLAAIARLAQKLGVPIARPAIAGTEENDLDLSVRAIPSSDGVTILIDRWTARPPQPRRWPAPVESPAAEPASLETFETDGELKMLRVSAPLARRLGVSADKVPGLPLTKLFRLEADDEGEMPLLAAVAGRGSFSGQRARLLAGGDALFLLSGEPKMVDGQLTGYQGQVQADAALPAEPPPKFDDLLREPLASIISEAQQIAARAEGPIRSDYAAYASDIAAAARHLLEVLQSMGQQVGQAAPAEDAIDLTALAAEAAGLVNSAASKRGVTLAVEREGRVPASGQSSAITQILVNLIGNAVRYSPEGGTVRIVVSSGEKASVLVADEGPGVAPWDRDRIFEAFEQAEPRGEGAGLGLAISRRLAQSMGGDIALEDTGPGEGARFTLTLPLA